jgi:hypothetical protein
MILIDAIPHLSISATCLIDVKMVVATGYIQLVRLKHVVKHPHHPERELTYIVVPAYVPNSLAPRVIRFKFQDRLRQHPIGFQSATLEIAQNNKHFCAY